jgi:hypothetical protein
VVQFFKEFHSDDKIMERHRKGKILVVELNGNVIATGTLVGSEISTFSFTLNSNAEDTVDF